MARDLGPGLHPLADLSPGDRWEVGPLTVTAEKIAAFAALTGDESARHQGEGAVAHGLLLISLIEGMKAQAAVQIATHTALAWEIRFRAPVPPGAALRAGIEVRAVRRMGAGAMVVLGIEGWTEVRVLEAEARYLGHLTR